MEMLRVDTFTHIVDLLPPAFSHRRDFHSVFVRFDEHWHNSQSEDLGRTSLEITFYREEGEWTFQVGEKRWPVDLLVDTIRRLPAVSVVNADFVNMHVSERMVAIAYNEEALPNTIPLRMVMFNKAYFDNPNGSRPSLDWAIRVGRKEFDD